MLPEKRGLSVNLIVIDSLLCFPLYFPSIFYRKEISVNILQINASARHEGGQSTQLANSIVDRLRSKNPTAKLVLRDLARHPAQLIDDAALSALFSPPEKRTPEQAARVAMDDALIAEVQAADILVLGVPMYNFSISVQLKAWLDAITRAKVTFRYTENGAEGLLQGRKVYVALARGGRYRDTPADSQVPYLKTILGFIGLNDVEFIYAEGLAMGAESASQSLSQAQADIASAIA